MDFGQVGAASLWKSGPLFSTGTKEAELMLEELRLNPRTMAAQLGGRCPGQTRASDDAKVDPILSTGSAEGARLRSTGPRRRIHSGWPGMEEGVVG